MIVALDHGDRFIGMAAGKPPDIPVHRLGVIDQAREDAMARIQELVAQEQVTKVLVGVPVGLGGDETEQTHKALAFMEKLRDNLGLEVDVEGIDETLTSAEAGRIVSAEGGRPEDEHAEAARLMLADYFIRNSLVE